MLRIVISVLLGCISAFAQGDVIPASTAPLAPSTNSTTTRTPQAEVLLPEDSSAPDPMSFREGDALIPSGTQGAALLDTSALAEVRKQTIRYREVRMKAEQMPALVKLKDKARIAACAEDERAALREYYRTLFAQVTKLDPTLEEKCKVMEAAYLDRLTQKNIEPTIPLNPPPKPESTE